MKRELDFFGDREAVLIYIAKRLNDALRLESALGAAGVDYGVETDQYRGGVLFQTARVGAFFYVLPEAEAAARAAMTAAGFKPYTEPAPSKA